jgi:hypothetical protein
VRKLPLTFIYKNSWSYASSLPYIFLTFLWDDPHLRYCTYFIQISPLW